MTYLMFLILTSTKWKKKFHLPKWNKSQLYWIQDMFFQEQTVSSCYHYLFIVQTMILRSLISHVILYRKKWNNFSEIFKLARAHQCLLTNYHRVTTLLKIDSISFLCIVRHIKIFMEMKLKLQKFILKLFDYFFS